MGNTFVVEREIEVPDEFDGPDGPTTTVRFRKIKAGDLLVLDGKKEVAGQMALIAALTGLTPGMVGKMSLENYAALTEVLTEMTAPLKTKSGA